MNGLLSFYDRGPLTPEERYQAALRTRIAEAQGMMDDFNERASSYIPYPTGFNSDNPLIIYPTMIYNGLLGYFRGENFSDMVRDADTLGRYIRRQSEQVREIDPSVQYDKRQSDLMSMLTPVDAQDVRPLPILRSK